MNICLDINIDDKLTTGLSYVFDILDKINNIKDEVIYIDFSKTKFVSPTFVLPLFLFFKKSRKQIHPINIPTYLSTIHFDGGYVADNARIQSFRANIESYGKKTYIPIIDFPTSENRDDIKNNILSAIESLIIKQTGIQHNIAIGFKYIIEEYVDNITQHSKSDRGYIFAQAYPKKHYLDVCIGDVGITLLGSYKENNDQDITTDLEAIQAANRGISTKNLPNAENRGYGIITSKKMLIDGLGGSVIMMSGRAMSVYNDQINKFIELPKEIRCPGTIISFRIPYESTDFNYINYVE